MCVCVCVYHTQVAALATEPFDDQAPAQPDEPTAPDASSDTDTHTSDTHSDDASQNSPHPDPTNGSDSETHDHMHAADDADARGGRGMGAGGAATGEPNGLLMDTTREARRQRDLHAAVRAFAPVGDHIRAVHVTSFCITPDLMDTIASTFRNISALALFMPGCHVVTPNLLPDLSELLTISGAKQVRAGDPQGLRTYIYVCPVGVMARHRASSTFLALTKHRIASVCC